MKGLLVLMLLQPTTGGDRVGVAWLDATADAAWRQRVTEELITVAGADGGQVEPDVVARARWGVAYSVARDVGLAHAELTRGLEQATVAYRGGDFEAAVTGARAVLEGLERQAEIPGAARLAWRAQVLLAQVGFATRDAEATDRALRAAVTLDPEAVVSARRAPPDLVKRHQEIRAEVLESASRWISSRGAVGRDMDPGEVDVEVDGRADDQVPPGEHFIVLREPGHPPRAGFLAPGPGVTLPATPELIPKEAPRTREAAERVCDHAEVDVLVLVRRRGERTGLERYRCGEGFGPAVFVGPDALAMGVREALTGEGPAGAASRVARDPWPAPAVEVVPEPPRPATVDRKPWFRRAWVWVLVGTVVAGAVTTGVVLGTREAGRSVRVDVPSFTAGE